MRSTQSLPSPPIRCGSLQWRWPTRRRRRAAPRRRSRITAARSAATLLAELNAFFVCSLWLLACALLLIKMLGLVPWERGEWWDELLGHLILGAILALFVLPPPRRRKGINA